MTDPGDIGEMQRRIWAGMRELVLSPARRKAEVAAELGVSFARARVLPRLAAGPLTLRQLAESLATDAPYATLIVDDLQERGLVRREPHPTDGRAKLVVLTAAGRRAADRAAEILDTPPAALNGLDAADLAQLDRIMSRLTDPDAA